MKFDIRQIATRKGQYVFPEIAPRIGSEIAYRRAMNAMLREIAATTRKDVIPAYRAEKALVQDGPDEWTQALRLMRRSLIERASSMVARILNLEADIHTAAWRASVERAIGIDVSAMIQREGLADAIELAVRRNTQLITSLADDMIGRVEQAVLQNATSGGSVKALRERLQNDFGIADRRARLIARDQMGKINSEMSQIRHREAGIEEYVWSTSRDERVRSLHADLDGTTYKYGQPTGAEEGLPPGQPIQCRCTARAVVTF